MDKWSMNTKRIKLTVSVCYGDKTESACYGDKTESCANEGGTNSEFSCTPMEQLTESEHFSKALYFKNSGIISLIRTSG